MNEIEIYLRIPGKVCDRCTSVIDLDKDFNNFSFEMIDFIQKNKFIEIQNECTLQSCNKIISHIPITIKYNHDCDSPNCFPETEDYFCSKECTIQFIKDKIDIKRKREELKKLSEGD